MDSSKRVTVLIHGSWMGAWCWEDVATQLGRHQIMNVCPTLAGLGDRAGETSPSIGLAVHVADVVACIDAADASSFTLVGHSYGALVAAEAAARRSERVSQLVILDGPIAEAGMSLLDLHPEAEAALDSLVDPAIPGFIQPPSPEFFGLTPSSQTSIVMRRLAPMPLRTHRDAAVHSADDLGCGLRYIRFNGFPMFEATAASAAARGWRVTSIDGGHMAIIECPELIADLIAETEGFAH